MRIILYFLAALSCASNVFGADLEASEVVKKAVSYWRDSSSRAQAEMVIHRPTWERKMEFESMTKGNKMSLVRFTAPAKDAGSATLSLDDETWSYAPKINKIVKIPASMKAQSWMGSDFSYRDLTRSDDIIDQYTHKILSVQNGPPRVFVIESIPKESAAVVWGREVLSIREDLVILRHEFFDQNGKLVKVMEAKEVALMDGKMFPKVMRISKTEVEDEWTQIVHRSMKFREDIPDSFFTLNALSSKR